MKSKYFLIFAVLGLLASPIMMSGNLHALRVKVEPSITFNTGHRHYVRPAPRPVRRVHRVPQYYPPAYYYYEPAPVYYEYYEPYYYPEATLRLKFW